MWLPFLWKLKREGLRTPSALNFGRQRQLPATIGSNPILEENVVKKFLLFSASAQLSAAGMIFRCWRQICKICSVCTYPLSRDTFLGMYRPT